jgi:tRNA (cytidine/uridine-2'-O-)-methyltransferase
MLDVVLYQPEIPANAGNIVRLAANTGMRLHLVKPLGFRLSDRALKRAGLDYGALADVRVHLNWETCASSLAPQRCFAFTTRGAVGYTEAAFAAGDALVFGPETRGLPENFLATIAPERRLRIPMRAGSRSLNLANAVAVAVYEAWRQLGFAGAGADGSGGSRPPA